MRHTPLTAGGRPSSAARVGGLRVLLTAGAVLVAAVAGAQPDPTAPSGLAVRASAGGLVTFAWTPPAMGAPEHYVVDGGLFPGQTLVSLDTGRDAPTFTVQVQPGVYYARVRAAAGGAISPPSNEVRLVVGASEPPSAPAHLLGVVDGSALALSWTPTFTGGDAAIVGLMVQGPVGGIVPVGLAETFEVANVPPGTYTVQALAANAAGVSAPSNPVTLTFPAACTGVPGVPTGLIAERWDRVVGVSWQPPVTGAAVTRYRLFLSAPGDTPPAALDVPAPGLGWPTYGFSVTVHGRQVAGALSPSWYTFMVQAENACGASAMTAPVTIIVP